MDDQYQAMIHTRNYIQLKINSTHFLREYLPHITHCILETRDDDQRNTYTLK